MSSKNTVLWKAANIISGIRRWGVTKFVVLASVVVVAGVTLVTFLFNRYRQPRKPRHQVFWMHATYNLTGNQELDRALANLPAATSARVSVMGDALHGLFTELPHHETAASRKATIKLKSEVSGVTGLPFEHFLFEWTEPILTANPFGAIRVKPSSTDAALTGGDRIRVQIIQLDEPGKKRMVKVQSVIEQINDKDGTATPAATCESVPIDIKDNSASVVEAVDAIASCIITHFIERTIGIRDEMFRSKREAEQFAHAYKPILDLGDSRRQRKLLNGIERYYTFAKTWESQPGDASVALSDAESALHEAAGADDRNNPRYPLAEYLYVHAATTMALGPSEAVARRTSHDKEFTHLPYHVELAFKTWPFSCSRWSQALALQAIHKPEEAREAWKQLQEPPDTSCAEFDSLERYQSYKQMAGLQIVNSYWYASDYATAMSRRCESGLMLTAVAREDEELVPPTDIQELSSYLSDTVGWTCSERSACGKERPDAPSALVGHRNFFSCAAPTSDHISQRSIPPADTIALAAAGFEHAIDYLLVEQTVHNRAEIVPFHQGLVQFLEEDMRPLRHAATEAVCSYQALGSKKDDTERVELARDAVAMEKELVNCRDGKADCEGLRLATADFLAQWARVARHRAIKHLDQALARLQQERLELCEGFQPRPKECVEVSTSAPPPDASTSAPPPDASTSAPAGAASSANTVKTKVRDLSSRSRARTLDNAAHNQAHEAMAVDELTRKHSLLVQIADLETRVVSLHIPLMCRELAESTSKPAEALREIRNKHLRLLRAAASREQIASALGRCAITLLGAPQVKALIKAERWAHVDESWGWNPPTADAAFEVEQVLRGSESKVNGRSLFFAQLHFATLWPAIAHEVEGLDSDAVRDEARRTQKQAQEELRTNGEWVGKKAALESIWIHVTGSDDTRRRLGVIGSALARELRRGTDVSGLSCREAASMSACAGEADPTVPARCGVSKVACVLNESRAAYDAWSERSSAKTRKEVSKVINEAIRRATAARTRFDEMAQIATNNLLSEFGRHMQTANWEGDPGIRIGIIRLAALLRKSPYDKPSDNTVRELGPSAFRQTLRTALRTAPGKVRLWPLISSNTIVNDLRGQGIFFKDENEDTIRDLGQAVNVLEKRPGSKCSNSSNNKRWARRFFGHVALNLAAYRMQHAVDRQRVGSLDLVRTYETWCAWGSYQSMPQVMDEEVLALSWVFQEDSQASGTRGTVLSGDTLGGYMSRYAMLLAGQPQPATYLHRTDSEARLLDARSAFKLRQGSQALRSASDAMRTFPRGGFPVVDAAPTIMHADATMLLAWRDGSTEAYQRAKLAYERAPRGGTIQKLRYAAALLEVHQNKHALEIVREYVDKCHKARLLAAIVLWRQGERDKARELTKKIGVSFAQLNQDVADPSPMCSGADGPVFIGGQARAVTRFILRERSAQ